MRTLLPEERWIKHNQHPDSESPQSEFTAFLSTLANTPRLLTLVFPKAGPSTSIQQLRIGRSSWLHMRLQTPAAPFQAVPEADSTPTFIPMPTPQELLLRDQINVRYINEPAALPPI